MSLTKREYHDEICRMMWDDSREEEYFASMEEPDETEIDWFSDFRLAHDGYLEFDEPSFSMDFSGEDLPF